MRCEIQRAPARGDAANPLRRAAVVKILACALTVPGLFAPRVRAQQVRTHPANLPLAADFTADAMASARDRVPIVVFYDRRDCPYCERALQRYLVPMSQEAPWRERAIFRQVEVDEALPLVDFDGRATTHERFAAHQGMRLTPTVVVVDGRGQPIGNAVVGLPGADFYLGYLEAAIDAGVAHLRR